MLAEILHKAAQMEQEEKPDRTYRPAPWLAGPDRCIRQMVYWGLGFPKTPLPGRAVHVFSDSSWHEELTGDWLRKTAFRLHSEQMKVEIHSKDGMKKGPLKLNGYIDGILTDILAVDRLLEHKAINHFSFERYWNGEIPWDNITQTCLYLHGLVDINPDITEAVLLMKNKNTAAYLEFLITYDREKDIATIISRTNSNGETVKMDFVIENPVNDAFTKFASVEDYVKRKVLPKRQYDLDDWHCQYCQWGETCWQNYAHEFGELKTDAILPDEFADTVGYYKELGGQMADIRKEREGIAETIKDALKASDAREGRAGDYICKLSLQNRSRIDESKIPAHVLKEAKSESFFERLNISKIKGVGK